MDHRDNALRAMGWARTLPVSSGVRAGRAWARRHLDALGWTVHAPETADAVVLTVSELITNAHIHARSDADLVLTWDGSCLYVSVHDDSPQLPRPREAGPEATSGRGMRLVDALADAWQSRPDTRGKTVTACFHPPGRPGH
ncbi:MULTISPECIES: ATP-binding protein [Kitasatospora]|uniref:Histidine kinase/HSP90-like ATPase domain-containing protein n=1 Tax=Kitasatospora arboriphila TaxID=258052 RepID=A0ABP4DXS4_9ACTN